MNKSKLFFAALVVALFTSVTSYANGPITNPNDMRTEIAQLVKNIDISDLKAEYERTYVQFIVNSKNEIIVVNVSNKEFAKRIQDKLNYKKLKTNDVNHNEIYTMPLVFRRNNLNRKGCFLRSPLVRRTPFLF